MGNRFAISVVSPDADWANARIDDAIAEISRLERLLTTYDDQSQTNWINAGAGIRPVVVDAEVFALIERSLRLSALTQVFHRVRLQILQRQRERGQSVGGQQPGSKPESRGFFRHLDGNSAPRTPARRLRFGG